MVDPTSRIEKACASIERKSNRSSAAAIAAAEERLFIALEVEVMWICVSADMTFNLRSNSAQIVLLKQRTLVRVRHDFNYDDWIFDILTPATSQHHSNARLVSRYCTVPTVRTTVVTSERSRASRRPILWCTCTVWQFAEDTDSAAHTIHSAAGKLTLLWLHNTAKLCSFQSWWRWCRWKDLHHGS